ncbi:MAG: hypothetical protein WDM90_08615 [Ferruginibacter sp.]
MDRMVDHLFAFEGDGVIKDFPGNYSQYREALANEKFTGYEVVAEKAPCCSRTCCKNKKLPTTNKRNYLLKKNWNLKL